MVKRAEEQDMNTPARSASDPATIMLEAARDASADLIVLGRRGQDFAARALLGSVAGSRATDRAHEPDRPPRTRLS